MRKIPFTIEIDNNLNFNTKNSSLITFPFLSVKYKKTKKISHSKITTSSYTPLFDRCMILIPSEVKNECSISFSDLPSYHIFFTLSFFDSNNKEIYKKNFHYFFDSILYDTSTIYIPNTCELYYNNYIVNFETKETYKIDFHNLHFNLDHITSNNFIHKINEYYYVSFSTSIHRYKKEKNKVIFVDKINFINNIGFEFTNYKYFGFDRYDVNWDNRTINKDEFELKINENGSYSIMFWIDKNNVPYIVLNVSGEFQDTIYILSLNLDIIVKLCVCDSFVSMSIVNDGYLKIYGTLDGDYVNKYLKANDEKWELNQHYLFRSLSDVTICQEPQKTHIAFYNEFGKEKSYLCRKNNDKKIFNPVGRCKVWFLCSMLL